MKIIMKLKQCPFSKKKKKNLQMLSVKYLGHRLDTGLQPSVFKSEDISVHLLNVTINQPIISPVQTTYP